ncbi:MAG: hypothetical protein ACKVI1_04725, partial [Flavobacteriales bacterium]
MMNTPSNSSYMSHIYAFTIGLCLLLLPGFYSLAQDSTDDALLSPSEFVKEMEANFAKGLVDNAKWMRREFGPSFLDDNLSDAIQDTIISTVSQLQAVHIRNSSGVLAYLQGALVQIEKGMDQNALNDWRSWNSQIRAMIVNKNWRKKLVPYLQLSPDLFSSGLIANKKTVVWQFQDGVVEFGLDSLPFIKCNNGTLVCYSNGDSARVRSTSGVFFPTLGRWKGTGGRVHWEGTTFNDSLQFAELNEYE